MDPEVDGGGAEAKGGKYIGGGGPGKTSITILRIDWLSDEMK